MDALDEVIAAQHALVQARAMHRGEILRLQAERDAAVRRAKQRGFRTGTLAKAMGITLGRVSQILCERSTAYDP